MTARAAYLNCFPLSTLCFSTSSVYLNSCEISQASRLSFTKTLRVDMTFKTCYTYTIVFLLLTMITNGDGGSKTACPLWYEQLMGNCECIDTLIEHFIQCSRDTLTVLSSFLCDMGQQHGVSSHCLLPLHPSRLFNMQKINGYYQISIKQCISGYGPAALSNGTSCTDCSKYQNIWLLLNFNK